MRFIFQQKISISHTVSNGIIWKFLRKKFLRLINFDKFLRKKFLRLINFEIFLRKKFLRIRVKIAKNKFRKNFFRKNFFRKRFLPLRYLWVLDIRIKYIPYSHQNSLPLIFAPLESNLLPLIFAPLIDLLFFSPIIHLKESFKELMRFKMDTLK